MSEIKKLAGQTMWYGASSIAARFINYLLTPYLTYSSSISTADFGKMGLIYSAIPVMNVLFTYGFETAYFRFSSIEKNKQSIYSTTIWSLIISTIFFSYIIWQNQLILGKLTGLENFTNLIQLSIGIIALDTLSAIPFARLRQQGRPVKFAFLKIAGILINILFTWFFISYCATHTQNVLVQLVYHPSINPIFYVLLANLLQSAFTLLFLANEFGSLKWEFNAPLWKEMMLYALPLVIVGLGGIVNETFDRLMLRAWQPGTELFKQEQVGIYNACYKLSILITLFVQAFKMGAEPFFFKQAESGNPQKTYARVMKFFVITICIMFLVVSLYLPIWQYFVGPQYRVGLGVVPILLLANMFLGIYYNLSIWYKLGNKTIAGTYITLAGTAFTLLINYFFIPTGGYMACAWATFFCYGSMMLFSYLWGQKEYPIPYAWKKLLAYLVIVVLFYFVHKLISNLWHNLYFGLTIASIELFIYVYFIARIEKKELEKISLLKKWVR